MINLIHKHKDRNIHHFAEYRNKWKASETTSDCDVSEDAHHKVAFNSVKPNLIRDMQNQNPDIYSFSKNVDYSKLTYG